MRTWWQHRKKGASTSAMKALESDKVRGIVDNYTRHFFNLAYCLVVNEGEIPPRSMITQWTQVKRLRERVTKNKQKKGLKSLAKYDSMTRNIEIPHLEDSNLPVSQCSSASTAKIGNHAPTQIDKLKSAQKRLLSQFYTVPMDNLNKSKEESQLKRMKSDDFLRNEIKEKQSADIHVVTQPVVLISDIGDLLICLKIDGMTYAHCVNIVETVLRGCDRKERVVPILGIVDAVADLNLQSVLIKIDKSSNAGRIALEAQRNLSLVGYTVSV